jgi:hypothetical protein
MAETQGTRAYGVEPHLLESGQYARWEGRWYGVPPGTDLLAGLEKHEVTEHEDGSITVSQSILVQGHEGHVIGRWHGYLERGVWREC